MDIWISQQVFNFDNYTACAHVTERKEWYDHYHIWEYAEKLPKLNEQDVACALFQLQRAIEFRDHLLNSYYNFNRSFFFKGKNQHEIMEELEIIKPIMKRKLNTLRNSVTHSRKAQICSAKECEELSEFVWYYLRCTDHLVASIKTDLTVEDNDPDIGDFTLTFDFTRGAIKCSGTIPNQFISYTPDLDSIAVKTNTRPFSFGTSKDLDIQGDLECTRGQYVYLCRRYFEPR